MPAGKGWSSKYVSTPSLQFLTNRPRENPQICDSSQRVILPGFVFLSFSIGLWLAFGSSWDAPAIKISPVDGCKHVGKAPRDEWRLGAYGGASGLGITLFAHGAQKLLDWFGGNSLSATIVWCSVSCLIF
jgi:hypothetical protein